MLFVNEGNDNSTLWLGKQGGSLLYLTDVSPNVFASSNTLSPHPLALVVPVRVTFHVKNCEPQM